MLLPSAGPVQRRSESVSTLPANVSDGVCRMGSRGWACGRSSPVELAKNLRDQDAHQIAGELLQPLDWNHRCPFVDELLEVTNLKWPEEKPKTLLEKKPENRVGKKRSRVVS